MQVCIIIRQMEVTIQLNSGLKKKKKVKQKQNKKD